MTPHPAANSTPLELGMQSVQAPMEIPGAAYRKFRFNAVKDRTHRGQNL
jgi:hypothetical protein